MIGEFRTDNPAQEYYLTDMVEILNSAGHQRGGAKGSRYGDELLGHQHPRWSLAAVDKIFRDRKRAR